VCLFFPVHPFSVQFLLLFSFPPSIPPPLNVGAPTPIPFFLQMMRDTFQKNRGTKWFTEFFFSQGCPPHLSPHSPKIEIPTPYTCSDLSFLPTLCSKQKTPPALRFTIAISCTYHPANNSPMLFSIPLTGLFPPFFCIPLSYNIEENYNTVPPSPSSFLHNTLHSPFLNWTEDSPYSSNKIIPFLKYLCFFGSVLSHPQFISFTLCVIQSHYLYPLFLPTFFFSHYLIPSIIFHYVKNV